MHKIILFVQIDYEVSEQNGVQLLTPIKLLIKVRGYLTSNIFYIARIDDKGCSGTQVALKGLSQSNFSESFRGHKSHLESV